MQQPKGITLIEILIVLAIMGIVMAVGWVNMQGARERTLVREGATQLATALLQARGEAQRYNSSVTVTINADNTGYTTTQIRGGNTVTRTATLPAGTVFQLPTGGASSVTYLAPYGEVANTGAAFCVRRSTQAAACGAAAVSAPRASVAVVGLTGKVVIAN